MTKGNVVRTKGGKVLVLADNKYYIVKGNGELGSDIEFDEQKSLPMPSYLFAIATREEENLDDTLDFIQTQWFNNKM